MLKIGDKVQFRDPDGDWESGGVLTSGLIKDTYPGQPEIYKNCRGYKVDHPSYPNLFVYAGMKAIRKVKEVS